MVCVFDDSVNVGYSGQNKKCAQKKDITQNMDGRCVGASTIVIDRSSISVDGEGSALSCVRGLPGIPSPQKNPDRSLGWVFKRIWFLN